MEEMRSDSWVTTGGRSSGTIEKSALHISPGCSLTVSSAVSSDLRLDTFKENKSVVMFQTAALGV